MHGKGATNSRSINVAPFLESYLIRNPWTRAASLSDSPPGGFGGTEKIRYNPQNPCSPVWSHRRSSIACLVGHHSTEGARSEQ